MADSIHKIWHESEVATLGVTKEYGAPTFIDYTAADPLGAYPVLVLRKGTVISPIVSAGISTGKYKQLVMANASAGCTAGQTAVQVSEIGAYTDPNGVASRTMFAAGDVIGVVPQATPFAAASALGTVSSISGTTITLVANAATAVTSGDIIVLIATDPLSNGAKQNDTRVLDCDVDHRNPVGLGMDMGVDAAVTGKAFASALRWAASPSAIMWERLNYILTQHPTHITVIDSIPGQVG